MVYINGYYLLFNLVGVVLLWVLYGEYYRVSLYLKVFVWCGLGISVGFYFYVLDFIWYVGLLGVLYGIFVWGVCMDIFNCMKLGWVLLVGVVVKVIYE